MGNKTRNEAAELQLQDRTLRGVLRERVKELDCLFEVAKILVYPEISVSAALERIAAIIPKSFSRPEETQVSIAYRGDIYTAGAGGVRHDSIREELLVRGEAIGTIEVGIVRAGDGQESRILPEERRLLSGIADLAAAVVQRIASEHFLAEAAEELSDKNAALREILFQIESEKRRYLRELCGLVESRLSVLVEETPGLSEEHGRKAMDELRHELDQFTTARAPRAADLLVTLSPREVQVCDYIRRGMSNKEIGELLSLSPMTVEKHRHSIRKKLGLTNTDVNLYSYLRNL